MPLSKAQVERILESIASRFRTFSYEALGPRALTRDELEALSRAGIVRSSVRHMIADPVVLGRVAALLPLSARAGLDFSAVEAALSRAPMTDVERSMIDFATDHAGTYISGIKDMMLRDVEGAASRAGMTALRAVQEGVSQAIADRETVSELKTQLFDMIDNRYRDWQRVAHTEINNAVQHGIYTEIAKNHGADQLVFKRPNPDACKHCKRLFLKEDGVTPRIFKLSDLEDTNVGLKAADWKPTIGTVHPWCQCQLIVIPDGYEFAKMMTVTEGFEAEGVQYHRGEIVSESTYAGFSVEDKKKTAQTAVLSFTGGSAKPDVEKSLFFEDDDACTCQH